VALFSSNFYDTKSESMAKMLMLYMPCIIFLIHCMACNALKFYYLSVRQLLL
jgi:hypothetical protein